MTRSEVYGRVKEAVFRAADGKLTVNQASRLYGLKARSIRSVADRLGVGLAKERKPTSNVRREAPTPTPGV